MLPLPAIALQVFLFHAAMDLTTYFDAMSAVPHLRMFFSSILTDHKVAEEWFGLKAWRLASKKIDVCMQSHIQGNSFQLGGWQRRLNIARAGRATRLKPSSL